MKLLYITNGICGAGGLERVLSIKASMLAEMPDYDVHILSLNESGNTPFYDFSPKITFHPIVAKGNFVSFYWSYIKNLKKAVAALRPDIIAVCDDGLKGFFIPKILGKPCPIIYERHASISLNVRDSAAGKLMRRLMRFLAADFDKFVLLTQSNISEWPVPNAMVIPNPLSFFPDRVSTLQNPKVIAVGSHSYNKGYDLLLEAWKPIQSRFPEWKLNIYGKADGDRSFIKRSAELELHSVHFFEPDLDIESKYLESSIMVLPSRSEGFGMVLIEAMACGVPCVAFDCPSGPSDIVSSGIDGFLVENGNIEAFSEKIVLLIENESLRRAMQTAARQSVKQYLPEAIVAQWDELFKSVAR
ncbi:MAG: glycosyltransferase family 4 protein [Flavobacterium sp.]|nr:MAG: glycosyltransferase family 4 protein [Flavobacterium sp.]